MRLTSACALALLITVLFTDKVSGDDGILRDKKWIHGSADCSANKDPAIEVFRHSRGSYILRQNKCHSFEAPFIYLLIGDHSALLLDTGASKSAAEFPLYETVRALIDAEAGADHALTIVHSHSHSDHYAGDSQFSGKAGVTVVQPEYSALMAFFSFQDWPNQPAYLQLGNRRLAVFPTPGHQEEAISIYDPRTKWLLTGDTIYPGYIYVKHWDEYKKSISRLATLSETLDVSAVLGAHIEMTLDPGKHYPVGTTYQPREASLALPTTSLTLLDSALQKTNGARVIVLDNLVVAPMSMFQRVISNIVRWLLR